MPFRNIVFAAIVAAFAVLCRAQAAPSPIRINQIPQDTTLKDLTTGTNKKFSSFYGPKGTLVYFWHPRCKLCVEQLYTLSKTKLPPGIGLITLTLVNETDTPKATALAREVNLPTLVDQGYTMAIQLKADVLPAYYVLGPKGILLSEKLSPAKGLKEKLDIYDNHSLYNLLALLSQKKGMPALVVPQAALTGKPAPALKLNDLNGNLRQLSEFKNAKGTAVIFYSPTCPHCQRELPRIAEYLKNGGTAKGYKAVAIALGNNDEHMQNIREYQATARYAWPVLPDPTGATMQNWRVAAYPTVYMVGPDLKIKAYFMGHLEDLASFFEKFKGQ